MAHYSISRFQIKSENNRIYYTICGNCNYKQCKSTYCSVTESIAILIYYAFYLYLMMIFYFETGRKYLHILYAIILGM